MEQENKSVIEGIVKNMGKLVMLTLKPIEQQKTIEEIPSKMKNPNCYTDPNIEIGYLHSLYIENSLYIEKPDDIYIEFIPLSERRHITFFLDEIESCNRLMKIETKKGLRIELSVVWLTG